MSAVPARTAGFHIVGGHVLAGGHFIEAAVEVTPAGLIGDVGSRPEGRRLDAGGLLVLPGIVDIHGDAFERQMMPRAQVHFPIDIALLETDRQAVANGITTVFHGVTWSWEPGLRGPDNARSLLAGIEGLRPQLAADTRLHLRHETYNLDAEAELIAWLTARRIDVLAFNDHMPLVLGALSRTSSFARMVERSGLSQDEFRRLAERVRSRREDVPESIARLARAAVAGGVTLVSHDDESPEQRQWYRSLGCRVAEFPTTVETAEAAAAADDDIVLGAPNVVRGGSHVGWPDATELIGRGLCSALASDYYYPAPLLAAFGLASSGKLALEKAWPLVSQTAAKAVGLSDRGHIAPGRRADLVLVDATATDRPRVVATIAGGRIVYLNEADRLLRTEDAT